MSLKATISEMAFLSETRSLSTCQTAISNLRAKATMALFGNALIAMRLTAVVNTSSQSSLANELLAIAMPEDWLNIAKQHLKS